MIRKRIDLKRIVNLFDDVDQALIKCFDVYLNNKPEPLTIKDFFKTHFKKAQCRYYEDEENDLITHFTNIFYNNLDLISKMQFIAGVDGRGQTEYIKQLGDINNFIEINTLTSKNTIQGNNRVLGNLKYDKEDNLISGNLQGTADVTQLTSLMDETNSVVEAKKILDKSNNKYLDYLDPNVRTTSHSIDINKNKFNLNQSNEDINTYQSLNQLDNEARGGRHIENIVILLNTEIPQIRTKFINKFSELFWY